MTGRARDFLGAFVVGGTIGVVGQLFTMLYKTLNVTPAMISILMLASIAVISTILDIFGIYGKLTVFSGMGAILPFCGLPPSIATIMKSQLSEGKPFIKAALAALKPATIILGSGYVFCFIVALIVNALA